MFGNLVQIELLRLYRNKALKIGGTAGALMLLFFVVMEDFLVTFGALDTVALSGISESSFRATIFITSFAAVMQIVIAVDVVYTTCDYQRSRLAVNIEGAIRNRLKLCLSEITGIFLFTCILNAFVFPGLLLIFITEPYKLSLIAGDIGSDILIMIASLTLMQLYTMLVVYLISKFTYKALFALVLSLVVSFLGITASFFIMAMVNRLSSDATFMNINIIDVAIFILMAVPIVVLTIALAVRYKRMDRI